MRERAERIEKMEALFDEACAAVRALDEALEGYDKVREKLRVLDEYYRSGEWKADFEADERGELPEGLKRGVLSEDGLYDLLTENDRLRERVGEG